VEIIPNTDLRIFPLCLGGNVLGWTADKAASEAVLDAYVDGGGNFIDTADVYSEWVPGNEGGESERILGEWMAARGNRERVVIATKVGQLPGLDNLRPDTIRAAADASLQRLRSDYIDLYYAHEDDPDTALEETLGAFAELIAAGKVRAIGASNIEAPRLADGLDLSDHDGLPRYVALQPHYNLVERQDYEDEGLREICVDREVACIPYSALAEGFLTGKHRPGRPADSERGENARVYLDDPRGLRVLEALDVVAERRGASPAQVSLAWLLAQDGVVAPIASARTPEQVSELVSASEVTLDPEDLDALASASRPHR
jgi:aryl-alcohol dehydrogenase-like predicted oxidoreductase